MFGKHYDILRIISYFNYNKIHHYKHKLLIKHLNHLYMQYKLFIIHKKYTFDHISNIMFRLNIQKIQMNKYIMYYLHFFLYLSYILILILYHHIYLYVLYTVYSPMIYFKYNYHHRFYKYQDIYITHQLILFFLLYI